MDALRFLGYIFDLDGTVYRGEKLIPGAKEAIAKLRSLGKKVLFISNKPLQTRRDYAEKLSRLGISTQTDEVINSSWVMTRWLSRHASGATLFIIGEPPFIKEMIDAGFVMSEDPAKIEYVIASFDRTFDYRKLNIALQAIRKGARFLATNPDRTCPIEDGEIPDCAAIIGAVEGATAKRIETIVGKPSEIMIQMCLEAMALPPSLCLIVGDRLETDIVMGKKVGMATALVLTGVTPAKQLVQLDIHPDYVWPSIAELLKDEN